MHSQFEQFNPSRSPRWRYDHCLSLVEHSPRPKPASPKDDQYVRTYRRFLLRFHREDATSDSQRHQLFSANPGLYYAHSLYHQNDTEWRSILEARILTGASDEDIAETLGTLPETVDWYEQLFFNVRDRIDKQDWIVKTVIGTPAARLANRYDTTTDHQRDMLYRLFGYFGGPLVLSVIVSGFESRSLPNKTSQLANWFDSAIQTAIRRRAVMEAQRFEVDKFKVMELLNLHANLVNAAKGSGGSGNVDYTKILEAAVSSVPWALAGKGVRELPATQQRFLTSHVEPRADEQLQLASGELPSTLVAREQSTDTSLILAGKEA